MNKEVIIDGIKYIPEKALNEDTAVGSVDLPSDFAHITNIAMIDGEGNKKPISDLYHLKYTQSEVDAIREETGFWTDELVHEYTSRVILNKDNYGTAENAIQKFKKSKQPPLVDNSNIPDEILSEWITKARPLVDSAWNLAIDEAIRKVEDLMVKPEVLSNNDRFIVSKSLITNQLANLKKQ